MINYRLPKTVEIDGEDFPINDNGDYRVMLDIIAVMDDKELSDDEKIFCELNIFYNFNCPENQQSAFDELNKFINCGVEDSPTASDDKPPLMVWEKDFPVICDDINAKYGIDIRGLDYLHWWTFVSYYKNLGEGQFSTIVNIRQKKQKGKKLENWEQEFYAENREKVDIEWSNLTDDEQEFLDNLFGRD